jgi:hypothetical protein
MGKQGSEQEAWLFLVIVPIISMCVRHVRTWIISVDSV